jgi:hypothetical protein
VRGLAGEALEDRGEMGLRLEADAQRDIDERQFGIAQQLAGAVDPALQDEVVRPHPCGHPELGGKVHAGEAGGGCHVGQGDAAGEMAVDKVDDPFQPPLLKRRATASRRRQNLGLIDRCGAIVLHRDQDEHPIEGDPDGMLRQLNKHRLALLWRLQAKLTSFGGRHPFYARSVDLYLRMPAALIPYRGS